MTLISFTQLGQMIGFIVLTILPGILIIKILKLNTLDTIEKIVLSTGISIAFIMLTGLFINVLYFYFGYKTPLSKNSLIITFSFILIVLYIIGIKTNKENLFIFSKNFSLSTIEKLFLIIPIFFPPLSVYGTYIMNTTNNNFVLIFLLFLISTYVTFVCIFNQKFSQRFYPVVIFLISVSLLLLLSLRSNYIIGNDIQYEYNLFLLTLNNLHWEIIDNTPLNATLSISLLPAIYQSILNIRTEFLFKIFYSIIYSTTPLIIYILSKKYVKEFYAFLSSCFFMFQSIFLSTEDNPRSSIAIFFFALAMMVLFSDKINMKKKKILIIIFITSVIISHYTTAYIFFFMIFGTFVGLKILTRFNKNLNFRHIINLTLVLLFLVIMFFWYSQITDTAFGYGIHFIEESINSFNRFFIYDSRHESANAIFGKNIEMGIPYKIQWIYTWTTFIFIGIGVVNIMISEIKSKKSNILKERFDVEYFLIATLGCLLLITTIVLPYISRGYGMDRLYGMVIVILSIFFVIGGVTISKYLKTREYIIILLVLIPYFLTISGVIYNIFGIPQSIILDSKGDWYDRLYIHDQEIYSIEWLKSNMYEKAKILSDCDGINRLVGQGNIRSTGFVWGLIEENTTIKDEYIYLRYTSVINKKLLDFEQKWHNLTEDKFYKINKIYSNKGSDIWKGSVEDLI